MATFKKSQLWLLPLCLLLVTNNALCMEEGADGMALTVLGSSSGSGNGAALTVLDGTYSVMAAQASVLGDAEQGPRAPHAEEEKESRKQKCKRACLFVSIKLATLAIGAGLTYAATYLATGSSNPSAEIAALKTQVTAAEAKATVAETGRDRCVFVDLAGCKGSLTGCEGSLQGCNGTVALVTGQRDQCVGTDLPGCQAQVAAAQTLTSANDADETMIDACRSGLGGTCGAGCKAEIGGFLGVSTEVVAVAKAIKAAQDASGCDGACVAEMTACMVP